MSGVPDIDAAPSLGRRRLLTLVAAASGLGAVGSALVVWGGSGNAPESERVAALSALGRRVIASAPELADVEALTSEDDERRAELLATELSAAVSDDFANGRVVEVDGWILSATEAQVAAAIAAST